MQATRESAPRPSTWLPVVAAALALSGASPSWAAPGAVAPATNAAALKVDQVIIVFKTHFDIGYTDMASNVVTKYRTTMMDQALKVVDANRDLPPEQQFVWTLPGWPMKKITEDWPGQTSERQQRVLEAFKDGRFVVHALPFTTHTELLEPEDLVRGMRFSSDLSRAAGKPLPRDAKMTDVPSHSWIMPTLLRHAGVDFLHLGCNPASRSPQVPPLFWWEGPDGSRVLTMYSAQQYGTGLIPPKDWPYKTWLALIHTGDNHGPPTPDEVKKLLDQARQKLPSVKVRIGRLSDFADAILAEKADIPVVRGDMPDTWIHGPMSDPQGAKLARNIRPAITTADLLNTMLRTWGVKAPDIRDTVAKSYEQSLLYGEHTWGGAQSWITGYGKDTKWSYGDAWRSERAAGRFQRLESSWAEHTAYIEKAQEISRPLLQSELQELADSVGKISNRQPERTRIVVYNPLPWKRSGVVKMQVAHTPLGKFKSHTWVVIPKGRETSTLWNYHNDGDSLRVLAREIPASGYSAFMMSSAVIDRFPQQSEGVAMENEFLKVAFDPERGTIKSLVDKASGRELVDASASLGFGQFLYERFASNQVAAYVKAYVKINADWAINELGKPSLPPAESTPYGAASPSKGQLKFEQSDSGEVAVMTMPASAEVPFEVSTKVLLYPNEPYLDLEMTIRGKPADPWPEAGWICLPFKVDAPQFRLGRLGSIIDPAKDIVRGANRNLCAVNTGLAVFDPQGRGAGLCPLDSPLVSLGEPGCWKYSLDYAPTKPVVYLNLFNNQWTTNFRFWNEGTWTARVRIWAFSRYDPLESLIRPSFEARFPLVAAISEGPFGTLPPTQAGLEVLQPGVLVTAFGPNPDGPGTLLRLWEMAGRSGSRQVLLPSGLAAQSVQPVDLRGRPVGERIPVKEGRFEVPMGAFAPASLLILEK